MTTEELLKPRYKVISDFWNNPFKVGDILQFIVENDYDEFFTGKILGKDWLSDWYPVKGGGTAQYHMRAFVEYPHLFKKLEWWEDREVKDMPMYLKFKDGGKIVQVMRWATCFHMMIKENEDYSFPASMLCNEFLPATKEEYQNYDRQRETIPN